MVFYTFKLAQLKCFDLFNKFFFPKYDTKILWILMQIFSKPWLWEQALLSALYRWAKKMCVYMNLLEVHGRATTWTEMSTGSLLLTVTVPGCPSQLSIPWAKILNWPLAEAVSQASTLARAVLPLTYIILCHWPYCLMFGFRGIKGLMGQLQVTVYSRKLLGCFWTL